MSTKVTRLLRQNPGGHLFIWAAHLAVRPDMEEVLLEEQDDTPVEVIKRRKPRKQEAEVEAEPSVGGVNTDLIGGNAEE